MLRAALTSRTSAKTTLRARRPPDDYIDLLSRSESDFRHFVEQLESNPMFSELLRQGVISRVKFRGRLPREKYEEFMDAEFFRFLETYGISRKQDWDKDFLAENALSRVPELSRKYQVPAGLLTRFLRYLRAASQDGRSLVKQTFTGGGPESYDQESDFSQTFSDPIQYITGDTRIDISDIIATAQEFVEKYGLSEQDFINDILSGEMAVDEICDTYNCSLREAEEVLDAAEQISFAESYESAVEAQPAPPPVSHPDSGASEETPIAFAHIKDDDSIALEFDAESVYIQRYRIRVKSLENPKVLDQDVEMREVIDRARFVNQRLSVLSRLITAVCERQRFFLASGKAIDLRPLSQADLARDLKEHQSTVSRIIRKKTVGTPHGNFPLTFLCQSKTDVVARLVQSNPDKPDIQIRDLLLNDYNCRIARRTVAYHRGKRMRRKTTGGETTAG
ncbi:MAG: hypothetical protein HY318_19315 [Armatimonadetes bacterium]|nr:hypothetical protein [Armatimonadota bacterium]